MTTAEIGNYGERVAAAFLRRHGYRVLTRNFQAADGEIDLVCRHGEMLVFAEVRTRGSEAFGRPSESIDSRKEEALRRAARSYLELLKRSDVNHRFDVVEVTIKPGTPPVCNLIPNFF
jgi:putative endonuclease